MSVKNRGFGSMSPERLKEVAAMGGKEAHRQGRAYVWNKTTAKAAAAKSVAARKAKRK